MARKIKIHVVDGETKVDIPAIRISTLRHLLSFGSRIGGSAWLRKHIDDDSGSWFIDHRKEVLDLIRLLEDEVENYEPFTLIEVHSGNEHVLIDVV